MTDQKGDRTPEMRRGRERLSVRQPRVEMALASLTIDGDDLADARRFGNRLAADAARWMAGGGLAQERRLTKRDAEYIWRRSFAGAGAK